MELRKKYVWKVALMSSVLLYSSQGLSADVSSSNPITVQNEANAAVIDYRSANDGVAIKVVKTVDKQPSPPPIFQSASAQVLSSDSEFIGSSAASSSGTLTVVAWLVGTLMLSFLSLPRDRRSKSL